MLGDFPAASLAKLKCWKQLRRERIETASQGRPTASTRCSVSRAALAAADHEATWETLVTSTRGKQEVRVPLLLLQGSKKDPRARRKQEKGKKAGRNDLVARWCRFFLQHPFPIWV